MDAAGYSVAVMPETEGDRPAAEALALRLGLPLADQAPDTVRAWLQLSGEQLSLQQSGPDAPGPVTVDFGAPAMRHRRRGGHNELLGRAVGVSKKPGLALLDATAGLGRDSFVLADLLCRVSMAEREPILAELLERGLARASAIGDAWLSDVLGRITLYRRDARNLPESLVRAQDVIYLDPMFPHRGKSAAVKKDMALFQLLLPRQVGEADSIALLDWARRQAVARVVVKRPLKAPPLGEQKPSHQIAGKSVRFDVYVLGSLT